MSAINSVSINWYSVAWNTRALSQYLQSGGDPNAQLRAFFVIILACIGMIRLSYVFIPFAVFLGFVGNLPVPSLLIIMPIIYCCQPAQPLIFYAIVSNNVDAIKLLVENGTDLTQKSIHRPHPLFLRDEYTPLEFVLQISAWTGWNCSPEYLSLLTPTTNNNNHQQQQQQQQSHAVTERDSFIQPVAVAV